MATTAKAIYTQAQWETAISGIAKSIYGENFLITDWGNLNNIALGAIGLESSRTVSDKGVATLVKLQLDYDVNQEPTVIAKTSGFTPTKAITAVIGNALDNHIALNDTGMGASGNAGDDYITGGFGDDKIDGNAGQDNLFGGLGDDKIDGGAGNDFISGLDGDDTLIGGAGNDVIHGEVGDDKIDGGAGNDIIDSDKGFGGEEVVPDGTGNDTVSGGAGGDMIDTGAGDDVIEGGTGVDTMTGGAGADKFEFSQTAEKIDSTFKAPDIIMDYNKAEGDTIKIGAGGITLIGNHVNAVKAVAFKAATATSDEVVAVTAVAEINAPAQGQAAFDVATHTLYVNTDATPAFEFAVVLTGITDFSQISIV